MFRRRPEPIRVEKACGFDASPWSPNDARTARLFARPTELDPMAVAAGGARQSAGAGSVAGLWRRNAASPARPGRRRAAGAGRLLVGLLPLAALSVGRRRHRSA